jgi:hypothetical protein
MRTAWLLPLAALVACAGPGTGAPNLVACLVDTEHAIVDLDAAPTGFALTPAGALALTVGGFTGHLDRADGAQVGLTLLIEATGAMTVQRRSWQPSPEGWRAEAADGLACEDAYAWPAAVALRALPDLDLGESLVLTVTASGMAAFAARLDAAEHDGTAAPPPDDLFDPDAITAIGLLWDGHRATDPWSGSVGFGIERHHGADGADGTVSYTYVAFGAWTAAAEVSGDRPPPP